MNDDIPSPKLQNDPHGSMVRGSNSFNAGLIRRRERYSSFIFILNIYIDHFYFIVETTDTKLFHQQDTDLSLPLEKTYKVLEETRIIQVFSVVLILVILIWSKFDKANWFRFWGNKSISEKFSDFLRWHVIWQQIFTKTRREQWRWFTRTIEQEVPLPINLNIFTSKKS